MAPQTPPYFEMHLVRWIFTWMLLFSWILVFAVTLSAFIPAYAKVLLSSPQCNDRLNVQPVQLWVRNEYIELL